MNSIYHPLDRSRNETRLVRLLAAETPTSTIVCELVHVSLEAEPPYEALSYTWDSGHATESIKLRGERLLGHRKPTCSTSCFTTELFMAFQKTGRDK